MSVFLRISIGFYVLATALGLVLRIFFVAPFQGLVFAHALHAHSHTLYFGWGALGILALVFQRLGANERSARMVLWAITGIAAATFVSFLEGGYSTTSIVISSLSLTVWFVSTWRVWSHARGSAGLDVAFLRAGLLYLVLASLGAIARVVLTAVDAPALYGSLAVFAFLHNFAWFFVFSVIGLLLGRAQELGARFDERFFRWQLWLSLPLAWLTFPLGVAGGVTGILGAVARIAGVGLLVPALLGAWGLWTAGGGATKPQSRASLRWLALWLGLEAVLAAAGGLGLAATAVHSRHLAILYLHVLLVGVVSLGLMLSIVSHLGAESRLSLWLHNLGLAVMALGLAAGGIGALTPDYPPGVPRMGLYLAVLGGAMIFSAGAGWAFAAARANREARAATQLSPSET